MCRGPRSSISPVPGNTGASHLRVGADATLLPDAFEQVQGANENAWKDMQNATHKSFEDLQKGWANALRHFM
jgi:hypothetical protein